MIRMTLVRHGRTAWNVDPGQPSEPGALPGRRFRGIINLPLAPQGVEQAQATARRLAANPGAWAPAAVYSSPLQRALRTAQILAAPHGLDVQVLPGLSSMDYGAWAGRLHSEVAREWPHLYQQWRRDPFGVQIPGGESTADLRARAVDAVRQIVARHDGDQRDSDIVLVSHQVVTKALICALAGLPGEAYWRVHQDLCNLSQLDHEPKSGGQNGTFLLRGLNDTCHLDPSLPGKRSDSVRVILVRHGQTAWNLGAGPERFRGRTDLPLDETGHGQAMALARRLQGETIDAVYTSPLQRTRQTVAPLAAHLELPIRPDERLQDIDYGAFQGLDRQQAASAFPQQYRAWLTTPGQAHLPQGESLGDVRRRLADLLDELAEQHRGQTVLLAGHQVVNKVLACTLLGLDLDRIWHVGQDTAAINVFQQIDGAWHVLRLNDTWHLNPANS